MGANLKKKGLQWDNRLFDPSQGGQVLVGDGTGVALPPLPVDEKGDYSGPSIGFRAVIKEPASTFEPGPPKPTREQAQAVGYTGDQCDNCNSMRMVHTGTCNTCQDCSTTTGCS